MKKITKKLLIGAAAVAVVSGGAATVVGYTNTNANKVPTAIVAVDKKTSTKYEYYTPWNRSSSTPPLKAAVKPEIKGVSVNVTPVKPEIKVVNDKVTPLKAWVLVTPVKPEIKAVIVKVTPPIKAPVKPEIKNAKEFILEEYLKGESVKVTSPIKAPVKPEIKAVKPEIKLVSDKVTPVKPEIKAVKPEIKAVSDPQFKEKIIYVALINKNGKYYLWYKRKKIPVPFKLRFKKFKNHFINVKHITIGDDCFLLYGNSIIKVPKSKNIKAAVKPEIKAFKPEIKEKIISVALINKNGNYHLWYKRKKIPVPFNLKFKKFKNQFINVKHITIGDDCFLLYGNSLIKVPKPKNIMV